MRHGRRCFWAEEGRWIEPLPDPDGIERRGGETWVSGGEWEVAIRVLVGGGIRE